MVDLRIGGVTVDRADAVDHARRYLTDGKGWAYPAYDGFDAAHATGPLVDADLLAPLLLNVNRISIGTYEALQGARERVQSVLDRIPLEPTLVDAEPEDLDLLGEPFAVLDGSGVRGARGAVLSKLLHPKRPAFIPRYDEQVRRVYQQQGPLSVVKGRSWAAFVPLFAVAVREDLRRELPLWKSIAAMATPPTPITPVRALDIVAWWAGRPGR